MSRLNYNESCPTCKQAGEDQKLFLDMDTCEIRCEVGHIFEQLPSEQALQTVSSEPLQDGRETEPKIEQRESQGVAVSPQADVQSGEGIGAKIEAVDAPVTPVYQTAGLNTLENEKVADVDAETIAAENAKLAEIAKLRVPGTAVRVSEIGFYVAEGMATKLPDGDVLLGVRIPEVWIQAVQAEAEAQLKSPAAYFSDWLTSPEMRAAVVDWLQNYWVSAYSQTV